MSWASWAHTAPKSMTAVAGTCRAASPAAWGSSSARPSGPRRWTSIPLAAARSASTANRLQLVGPGGHHHLAATLPGDLVTVAPGRAARPGPTGTARPWPTPAGSRCRRAPPPSCGRSGGRPRDPRPPPPPRRSRGRPAARPGRWPGPRSRRRPPPRRCGGAGRVWSRESPPRRDPRSGPRRHCPPRGRAPTGRCQNAPVQIQKLTATDAFIVFDLDGAPAAGITRSAPKILRTVPPPWPAP